MLNISFLYDRLIGKIASKTTPLRKNELYLLALTRKSGSRNRDASFFLYKKNSYRKMSLKNQ